MIEAKNLIKKYGDKLAVNDLSFKVETGKVTGFLGPNGAGKSTTMRLMVGLDNGGGHTTYDGKVLDTYKQPSKMVGILLEAKAFHPTRTARNHLSVLAAQGGMAQSRVNEVLDIVGLASEATGKPGKFSLGMSQRLGIAAALLGEPKYLILDEPSNGLDPEGIAWLRQFIRDYAKEGRGVLISSHLLSEMSQLADNVVVVGKGQLITATSMDHLIEGSGVSVFVRSTTQAGLEKILRAAKLNFKKKDDGLLVSVSKTDVVGQLAHSKNIVLLELSPHMASLEQAFLELTEGKAEYEASTKDVRK